MSEKSTLYENMKQNVLLQKIMNYYLHKKHILKLSSHHNIMSYVFTVGGSLLSSNVTYLLRAAFGRRKQKLDFPRKINESSKFCFV